METERSLLGTLIHLTRAKPFFIYCALNVTAKQDEVDQTGKKRNYVIPRQTKSPQPFARHCLRRRCSSRAHLLDLTSAKSNVL